LGCNEEGGENGNSEGPKNVMIGRLVQHLCDEDIRVQHLEGLRKEVGSCPADFETAY